MVCKEASASFRLAWMEIRYRFWTVKMRDEMNKLAVVDPKTNKFAEDILGATGFISYGRLEEMFRKQGEISDSEQVLRFVITEGGLSYRVGAK